MTEALGARLRSLFGPVDIASLAVFRILFGALLCVGALRFMAEGWIAPLYTEPTFFFKYPGFEWVRVWGSLGLYLHWSAIAALALMVSLGLFYRGAILGLFALFSYAQLMDVTNYLNHYLLVMLLLAALCAMPLGSALSLDVLRRPALRLDTVPRWMLTLLKLQIAVVYLSAGLAKLNPDWLLHAQPLGIWMAARQEMPLIGPLLTQPLAPLAMSWGGFLYDTLIVFFLLSPRTRLVAYGAVLVFHGLTALFFDIGLFPWIMTIATTLFFDPSWPRRLGARLGIPLKTASAALAPSPSPAPAAPPALSRAQGLGVAALITYGVLALLTPHRHLLYPGDVLWHEQGMRYAWKVMLREKSGSVTFHVAQRTEGETPGRTWRVSPTEYLTWRQANEFSGQPDLILQLAHHIQADFDARGLGPVAVRAEALVSLNGRPAAPMIDPEVDLTQEEAGILPWRWVTPGPTTPPPSRIHLSAARGPRPSPKERP